MDHRGDSNAGRAAVGGGCVYRAPMRALVSGYRIVFALLAAVAVGWQGHLVVADGRSLLNFFSYFTIESNIVGIVVFAWGGVVLRGAPALLRGAAVVYLVIT